MYNGVIKEYHDLVGPSKLSLFAAIRVADSQELSNGVV